MNYQRYRRNPVVNFPEREWQLNNKPAIFGRNTKTFLLPIVPLIG